MFLIVLFNVVIILAYMMIGFLLCKFKKMQARDAKSLSGLLVYVLSPFMVIKAFLDMEYSRDTLLDIVFFFLVSLAVQLLFYLLLYLILHKKFADAKYRILVAASLLGNVGFFGMPLISSIFPNDAIVVCYSSVYVMSMNLLVFTIGVFMITFDKKYISLKSALLNPTTIALVIALPLFIFNVQFPSFIDNAISLLAKMVTPVCMIILGMRLSTVSIKAMFTRNFVYFSAFLKLIVFPLLAYFLVYFLPFSEMFKIAILVLSATPSAAMLVSLAELHESEQELCANCVLFATLFSVLTIPLLLLILGFGF